MSHSLKVAVATSSPLAAEAAREVAEEGGNAVDCAIAASLLTMNTEPGVCALAGGAYVTVWAPGDTALTIDGGAAVPGLGQTADNQPDQGTRLSMDYGGGISTVVGGASVATPGALAACERAAKRWGSAPWHSLLAPSARAAREGFPLPSACRYYLQYSGTPIFGRSIDGHAALHDAAGNLKQTGDNVCVPHLADSLDAIGREGAALFYSGELGKKIADHVRAGGGALTRQDLIDYRPIERPALVVDLDRWQLALNPPPAVGGSMLAAMLLGFSAAVDKGWDADAVGALVAVQRAAMEYRRDSLDLASDLPAAAQTLIDRALDGQLLGSHQSGATVHTSAVDSDGLACAITSSAGYGSGEMPAGTGLWLNNCLGELELNRRGLDAGPPGARLPSNMAPGVARCGDEVLAFGSPGADRITTALQQFLINHLHFRRSMSEACAAPRLHVEVDNEVSVSVEAGLDLSMTTLPVTRYAEPSMYFGGVAAASWGPDRGLTAAADPRRAGGTYVSP